MAAAFRQPFSTAMGPHRKPSHASLEFGRAVRSMKCVITPTGRKRTSTEVNLPAK